MTTEKIAFYMVAIFLFTTGCVTSPQEIHSTRPLFVQGSYQIGHNRTEPHPSASRYFRTNNAGFMIENGEAGYMAFFDVLQLPPERIYTRAILQNPEDSKTPIVYDHYVDPGVKSVTVTHFPVNGLRSYKSYWIEFVSYSDEARTQEMDRLTQQVRSYVDTTGDVVLLSRKVVLDENQ